MKKIELNHRFVISLPVVTIALHQQQVVGEPCGVQLSMCATPK
jgi:hypothetical protein